MLNAKAQILVIGAGGVGGYYGGKLLAAGYDLTFLVRETTRQALVENGLAIKSSEGDRVFFPVQAVSQVDDKTYDIIILTVKATATDEALTQIAAAVGGGTTILSLQNGVDNEDKIEARFPNAQIVGGVAFIGSRQLAPGVIEHRAEGRATLGPWRPSDKAAAKKILTLFVDASIKSQYSENIRRDLWTKLMWNAAFNTTSCLAGAHVIEVLRVPGGQDMVRQIMREIQAVAGAEGVTIPDVAIENYINDTLRLEWGTTSMLVDRQADKPIETDAIVGVALKRAQTHGIAAPTLKLLYSLLSAYNAGLKNR